LANDLLAIGSYRRLLRAIGEGELEPAPANRPFWDPVNRTLRFEETQLIKLSSLKRAKTLAAILDTFENQQWCPRIRSPLKAHQQSYDAVSDLNHRQTRIDFHVDGDGKWITWAKR
jgi:hypothetical protein